MAANMGASKFYTEVCEERTWGCEAEDSPLLEAVARERLGRDTAGWKNLAGSVVICELWSLAVVLESRVLRSCEFISGK
jgi:hypothetical protein